MKLTLRNVLAIAAAAIIAAVAINVALVFVPWLDVSFRSVLGAVGAAMAASWTARQIKLREDGVLQDERTKKIHNAAMARSWWLTYVFIAVLLWADYLKLRVFDVQSVLSLTFFFMVASYTAMSWWLSSRGDA